VLARRTSITLVDRQRGLGALEDVVALMTREHNWSPEQQQSMSIDFRTAMQQQMAAEKVSVVDIPPMQKGYKSS